MHLQDETLLRWIIDRFAGVLGHDAARIGAQSPLEELGLESMSVVAMGRVLEAHFPLLAKTFLYDCRTVADVVAYLAAQFPAESAVLCASLSAPTPVAAGFSADWAPLDEPCAESSSLAANDAVAIVGVAGRYPGSPDLEAFLATLRGGVDAVGGVPPERWAVDGLYQHDPVARTQWASASRWGGFLSDVDAFDAAFFGIAAVDADVMDPQERLFLECAWHALEHAGLGPERLPRALPGGPARVGVFAGVTTLSYPLLGERMWRAGGGQVPSSMPWSIANRVSWLLDFDGPSMSLDTACSSSLTALHLACESLRRDECAVALAGGVNLYLHPSKYVQLSQQRMLSPTGRCHAFGEAADGFVPGEGVGVVVLRRLDDAVAAGDRILGVIRATALAHGGRTNGYTVPSSRSQATLIRSALDRAGLSAGAISCVEAHGTGTGLGDPVEIQGLLAAYGDEAPAAGSCALGSVKANIGHLESAAGVAGLTKILLQMASGELFASLHSSRVNPAIDLSRTPFRIPQQVEPWVAPGEHPRCAALSSFGAGGANAHVIVEEWRHGQAQGQSLGRSQGRSFADAAGPVATVFPFSATDDEQLAVLVGRFRDWLAPRLASLDTPAGRAGIAATLQLGRTPLRARLAVVAGSLAELHERLGHAGAAGAVAGLFRGVVAGGARSAALPPQSADAAELASRWVGGDGLSWSALWPAPPVPLDLPRYPFRRTRHWVGGGQSPVPSINAGPVASGMEPPAACLLGPDDWRARNHLVDGRPVFPAAGFLQLLAERATSQESSGDGAAMLEFSDLIWGRALVLDAPVSVAVEVDGEGRCAVRAAGDDGQAWLRGTVRRLHGAPPEPLPAGAVAHGEPFDRAAFYRGFDAMGLRYGDDFQPVRSIARHGDHAEAELAVVPREGGGLIDPALLDGVFQCAVALAPASVLGGGQAFVPFSLRRFALYGPLRERARVRVAYRGMSAPGLHVFDFIVSGSAGERLALIEGFCFRAYDGARTAPLHLLQRHWTAAAAVAPQPPDAAPMLVAGGAGVALDDLLTRLRRQDAARPLWCLGQSPHFRFHSERFVELDAGDVAHRRSLVELLAGQNAYPATFVWLAGAAAATVEPDVRRFVALAQALVGALGARALKLVYVGVPGEGDSGCFHAAMAGLLKSLHLEAPRVSAAVVELDAATRDDAPRRAEVLAAVLARPVAPGQAVRLRWAHGRIEDERFGWLDAPAVPWQPTPGGTYVITGGLGALGQTFARWLAGRCGVHVALVGRSPLDEEAARVVTTLGGPQASVIYAQGDAADAASLKSVLQQVRSTLGPVRGVIHAAGVLRDAFFLKHSEADWQAVLRPKIAAARLLDEATRDDPLEAFVMFSSLAGAHGNVGQSVYAYANAWLDEYARHRAQAVTDGLRRGRTLAIAWPLWRSESGMQAPPPVMQWMAERGLELLTPAQGVQALQAAMAGEAPNVIVCSGRRDGVAALLDVDAPAAVPVAAGGAGAAGALSDPLSDPLSDQLADRLADRLADLLARACGVARARIVPATPLQSLGLDSIMVMDLNGELDKHFSALPKTLLFEADTVQDLAARIEALEPQAAARFIGPVVSPVVSPVAGERAPAVVPVAAAAAVAQLPPPLPVSSTAPVPSTPGDDDHGLGIAIVGIAGRYPRAGDLQQFWDNLSNGLDCVAELSQRWPADAALSSRGAADGAALKSGAYARWAALIDGHDCFDPLFFGIAPRDAERMDPQERLFLEASWLAIEDAGYTPQALQSPPSRDGARGRVGVLAGVMYGEYQFYGAGGSATLTNSSYASIANRVSYTLGFSGASFALDSMCSSSLTAIHTACLLLRAGECDAVLAGGVNISSHPYRYRMLSELQFAASDGRCRSFGAGGDGYVPGEGVGVVVLKRLADAIRDGDHIHGVIRGSAIGHGGRTSGFTVPTPVGQGEVIRDAFAAARVSPARLGYIEAHGTGTSLGDPIELRGLALALDGQLAEGARCAIGSVKSQIGHLESAAGIAALTKVLLQMRHGRLVPSIHSTPPNPNIDFSKLPFRVQADGADWPSPRDAAGRPLARLAAVSSFGAGGSNAHLVVEEWAAPAPGAPADGGPQIVALSARTPDALRSMAQALASFVAAALAADGSALRVGAARYTLADVGATLRRARVPQPCRLALVAGDLRALGELLRHTAAGDFWQLDESSLPAGMFKGVADAELASGAPAGPGSTAAARARAWVSGAFDDWPDADEAPAWRRVPLPGTVFQRRRFWAQPPAAVPAHRVEQPVAAYAAVPAAAAPSPIAPIAPVAPVAPVASSRLSPREIYDQVVRGRLTPEDAKRLLAGMRQPLTENR